MKLYELNNKYGQRLHAVWANSRTEAFESVSKDMQRLVYTIDEVLI